ncbi:MAG: hypothetical protein R3212_07075, partial [Xanthomonadales bacterium]|nr:hypothetical protein [Xanthomonadales bacterium]
MASASPAWAQNPFNIDGNVPDAGAQEFDDPFGSSKELGPVNGASTKIGVIHNAATPMLAFTNPNGQTDLVRIWLDTEEDAGGDTWLYFAWERDSTSGANVITYEFQKEAFPVTCDFEAADVDFVLPISPGEADLIANCNPWSERQADDFLIVWDFKGGATDIILRTFDGMAFDAGVMIGASEAALNASTSRGEGAINLSETIFDESTCTSIASVITGTVTGNSDSADYKDTVFTDVVDDLTVSNCGTVIIRKETDPDGESGSFDYTHNLVLLPATGETSFSLSDDGDKTFTNVVTPGTGYMVSEDDPGSAWALTDLDCTASDASVNITENSLANRRVTFDLGRSEKLDCTFTNSLRPTVKVIKNVAVGSASPDDFDLTQDGVDVNSGQIVTHDIGDTVVIDEGDVDGYEFVSLSGTKCPSSLGGSTSALAAGDTITCTITNTLSPKVTLYKSLQTGGAGLNSFGLTQNGNGVNSGETVTYSVGQSVTIDEAGLAGYEFVEITGTGCPSSLGGTIGPLAAGDDISCTIVNTLSPTVTLIKSVQGGDALPDDFDLTQNGNDVDSGETITYMVGDT